MDLDLDSLDFAGALAFDRSATGVAPRRLPEWTRPQIVDPAFALMVAMPAGVRIRLRTDSPSISLGLMVTRLAMNGEAAPPAVVELLDGAGALLDEAAIEEGIVISVDRRTGAIEFLPGDEAGVTLRTGTESGSPRNLEVWLPHDAGVEVRRVSVAEGSQVEAASADTRRRWVHYGSSISHCLEADRPTGSWPVVTARLADLNLQHLGFAGQAQLDQFVARTIRDLPADVITLKLGINLVNADSMRERTFVPAVHGFLDTIREGHPTTPIVVISPIICPVAESRPGPTFVDDAGQFVVPTDRPSTMFEGALTLERIRELLETIVAVRQATDSNLRYVNGLELFGPDDVVSPGLPDGLHPDAAGYRLMGERAHRLLFAD
jgi:lysophospholipase L1-like esterase